VPSFVLTFAVDFVISQLALFGLQASWRIDEELLGGNEGSLSPFILLCLLSTAFY